MNQTEILNLPAVLNRKQFMNVLGISVNTFRDRQKKGLLPLPLPMSGERTARWSREAVLDYMNP